MLKAERKVLIRNHCVNLQRAFKGGESKELLHQSPPAHLSRVFSVCASELALSDNYPPFNDLSTSWIHSKCISVTHDIASTSIADLSWDSDLTWNSDLSWNSTLSLSADLSLIADLSWASFDDATAHWLV